MKKKVVKPNIWDVAVIGGGPAGLISAGIAAQNGAKVILIEKNETMGNKLLLTGGGRCNLTNAEPDERSFVSKYGKKGSFLFSPLSVFGVQDTIRFFEKIGLKTKVEAGYRVFPESDSAMDVLGVLTKFGMNNKVEYKLNSPVSHIKKLKDKIVSVILENGEEIRAKNFILATGGKSYPETGSTGDGFKWLKEIGHKIVPPNPSLVPIKVKESWIGDFAGISLDNVGVSVWQNDKKVLGKQGRILITHDGFSGPTILNMSKDIGDLLSNGEVIISLDFFPGVGLDVMNQMMIKVFEGNATKKIKNLIFKEVPEKIYLKILDLLGLNDDWFSNEVKKAERIELVERFKKFNFRVEGLHGFEKAIVSSGGVDLQEVDFKTMQSKLYDNLFLVGDILDFDKNSGGYSLQLCWNTGYIAGKSAAKNSEEI
jgi:predicted Rossmann fold flavoprotein